VEIVTTETRIVWTGSQAFCNARILDISIKEPDLEDVFLELAR
jgi:hypothetical protein